MYFVKGRRGGTKSSYCIEHECKNTQVEDFFHREEWMLSLLLLVFKNRLACSLYRIKCILILQWIMWSDEHRPCSSTSASVWVRARLLWTYQSCNHISFPSVYIKQRNSFIHMKYVQIDLIMKIFCMFFYAAHGILFVTIKDVYYMTSKYRSVHYKTYKECMSAYYRIKIHFRSQSEVITSTKVGLEFEKQTLIIAYIFNVPAWLCL